MPDRPMPLLRRRASLALIAAAGQPHWYGLPAGQDPELARRLQDALDQIRRDGRYERLRRAWFA